MDKRRRSPPGASPRPQRVSLRSSHFHTVIIFVEKAFIMIKPAPRVCRLWWLWQVTVVEDFPAIGVDDSLQMVTTPWSLDLRMARLTDARILRASPPSVGRYFLRGLELRLRFTRRIGRGTWYPRQYGIVALGVKAQSFSKRDLLAWWRCSSRSSRWVRLH